MLLEQGTRRQARRGVQNRLAAEVTWVGYKARLGTEYTVHMGPAKHQGSGQWKVRRVCLSEDSHIGASLP